MAATVTPTHERLQARLQSLLGPNLSVVCCGVDGDPHTLWAQEASAVCGAIARRQSEFAAGREAARRAMRRLTEAEIPIPSRVDRSPEWPAQIAGSIAHSRDTSVAVVGLHKHWLSIGIDLEPDLALESALWDLICTAEEMDAIGDQPADRQGSLVTRLFVAKEAFYKWHYPQRQTVLDFQDVNIRWLRGGNEFHVYWSAAADSTEAPVVDGRLWVIEDQLIACCATPAVPVHSGIPCPTLQAPMPDPLPSTSTA